MHVHAGCQLGAVRMRETNGPVYGGRVCGSI